MPPSPPAGIHLAHLDVFLLLARRPHSHCQSLHRLSRQPVTASSVRLRTKIQTRYASSAPSRSNIEYPPTPKSTAQPSDSSTPSKPSPPIRPTASSHTSVRPGTVGARSGIAIHVGLDRNPEGRSAISRIPIPKGERDEKFVPSVLARPLGLVEAPQAGQNAREDHRSWRARTQEFADPEQASVRRRIYLRSYLRPYFQEWKRLDHNRGKSFVSNTLLFKRSKALHFPNIQGPTLASPHDPSDTTPILTGKVSLIAMQAGRWAEEQVDSFFGATANPELVTIMARNQAMLQRVDINMQGDWMRALLVKMFQQRLREIIPQERWAKYFMVKLPRDIRRGLTEDVRDAMGLLNSQVGYVYLVDSSCKIRWAGSGDAAEGEVKGLNQAIGRLLEEEASLFKPS